MDRSTVPPGTILFETTAQRRVGAMAIEDVQTFTDAELTALALAADPDQPLGPEAVPLNEYLSSSVALLPEWYMAPVVARHIRTLPAARRPGRDRRLLGHRGLRALQHLRPVAVSLDLSHRISSRPCS